MRTTSQHQASGGCWMCHSGRAAHYFHCSYCGATLKTSTGLANHLDDGCEDAMWDDILNTCRCAKECK